VHYAYHAVAGGYGALGDERDQGGRGRAEKYQKQRRVESQSQRDSDSGQRGMRYRFAEKSHIFNGYKNSAPGAYYAYKRAHE